MAVAIQWRDLELVKALGEGQAGVVWLATLKKSFKDLPRGSSVAVKTYKSWVLEEKGQFERIIRELEIGRRVSHPNLVKTYSVIRDDSGNPALIMAYYNGETLDKYLQGLRNGKKSPDMEVAFRFIGGLASALGALHDAGVIHRDVKPANIILDNGKPILMDLGVVRSRDFPEQTTTGAFLGTIRYAAPEYLFGDEYDSRIDIYSVGAVAYELFVGEIFLSKEKQWARLILEKDNRYGRESVNVDYSTIQSRFGVKAAEFIRFLLEHTLSSDLKKRTINLEFLVEAIKAQLWNEPFFVRKHQLVLGEPEIPFLNKSDNSNVSPKAVADFLRTKLSDKDIELLHELLDRCYFHEGDLRDSDAEGLETKISASYSRLVEAGAIVSHWDPLMGGSNSMHPSAKAAYRYGYI